MNLFTSEELYVMASLLGKEFIIGVEGSTLENNISDLKGMFKKNYSELEAKGVFEYRIDGTLLVDRDVGKMINVLNKADNVFVVVADCNGKKEKANYLSYGELYCKLTEQGTQYLTEILDGFSYGSILEHYGISIPAAPVKKIDIGLNDFTAADSLYKSFNTEEADAYLSNLLEDPETEKLIRECLLNKNKAFVMKEYRRLGCRLVNVNELILKFTADHLLRFDINGADTVTVSIYRKEHD